MQKKQDIAAAERWRGSFNPNRACTRSVGSPGPDNSSVQANEISQQQKNSSRIIVTQIVHMGPVGWKPRARQQFSAGKTRIYSSRTVTQIRYAPVWLEVQGQTAVQRKQSDSPQQQNSSRAVSNRIGHAPVLLEAATTESREVRLSDTSHLTGPTEIQNSLA